MVTEKLKFLIVCDDSVHRSALEQLFQPSESVSVAESETEALQRIRDERFHMIILGMGNQKLKNLESAYGPVWDIMEKTPLVIFTPFARNEAETAAGGAPGKLASNEALHVIRSKVADHAHRTTRDFKIIEMLRDRELQIKEINHRIKNNLQTLVSMLNIQSIHMLDKVCLPMLQAIQLRIKSVAMIYEALYESGNVGEIDFGAYTKGLVNGIFKVFASDPSRIRLSLDLPPVIVDKDMAMHCGLILNELVTNALKYAFSDGRSGEIAVSLAETPGGRLEMSVADNGVGLPPDVDPETAESMGLLIVNALAQQIHADLSMDRANGTRFQISFKKPERIRPAS